MMTTAAVIGLSAGSRLLTSSHYFSDLTEKLSCSSDHGLVSYHQGFPWKNVITAKRTSNFSPSSLPNRHTHTIKALKEHVDTASDPPNAQPLFQKSNCLEDEIFDPNVSVEALLLLQKSLLEKQWNLSTETADTRQKTKKKMHITSSGISARRRRMETRRNCLSRKSSTAQPSKELRSIISPKPYHNRLKGYVKGVISEEILTHAEVVRLSKKIKTGLYLEEQKSRLEKRLGCAPSDGQLASSLKISRAELQFKLIESSLAREKLAMSNVRLVMSVAQRYDNLGAEMSDLVQGGLIGLLRGIEKFDSSKGFKISTYVYWWIRQGIQRVLVHNSGALRLPNHLHERLGLIRNAKFKLQAEGITPSVDKIAECLNMSEKKITNATEAVTKIFSLDREPYPSLTGVPGETHHSYIADDRPENNPWYAVEKNTIKDEINKLIDTALMAREREIIRLYYGFDSGCHTWEDISKRIGLSRERVRQVGLISLEKLKHAARRKKLDIMLKNIDLVW